MTGGGYQNPFAGITVTQGWLAKPQQGIEFSVLVDELNYLTAIVTSKIAIIRAKQSAMSIADMFDLQMAMNKLTQFSEMSTNVIQGMQTVIQSINRGMKA